MNDNIDVEIITDEIRGTTLKEGDICPATGIWTVGENNQFVSLEIFERDLCVLIKKGEPAPKVPLKLPYWVFYKEI